MHTTRMEHSRHIITLANVHTARLTALHTSRSNGRTTSALRSCAVVRGPAVTLRASCLGGLLGVCSWQAPAACSDTSICRLAPMPPWGLCATLAASLSVWHSRSP